MQFYCPRQSPYWQDYTESALIIFRKPVTFDTVRPACRVADSLIWQFHSARVIDQDGRILYQV